MNTWWGMKTGIMHINMIDNISDYLCGWIKQFYFPFDIEKKFEFHTKYVLLLRNVKDYLVSILKILMLIGLFSLFHSLEISIFPSKPNREPAMGIHSALGNLHVQISRHTTVHPTRASLKL